MELLSLSSNNEQQYKNSYGRYDSPHPKWKFKDCMCRDVTVIKTNPRYNKDKSNICYPPHNLILSHAFNKAHKFLEPFFFYERFEKF